MKYIIVHKIWYISTWIILILELILNTFAYIEYNKGCETCKMYSENAENGVLGIYYPSKDYYCVWMKDRTEAEINETEKHEYCHWLIDVDNIQHFCKEKN